MAREHIAHYKNYEVIGGYFSPVSSAYGKKDIIMGHHRVKMCEMAVEDSDWLMVDSWESRKEKEITYTRDYIDRVYDEVNKEGGIITPDGKYVKCSDKVGESKSIHVMMVCGGDMVESFGVPGLWKDSDVYLLLM